MLALSPRLPVGKVGVGWEERTLRGPCQPPVLEGKTCALGTRSSRSPQGPRSAGGSEGERALQHLACLSRAGVLSLCWTLTRWGKAGATFKQAQRSNLLVMRVAPATAPPTRPLRRVPSPAAFQVGQLGKERGRENDGGSHA